MPDRVELSLDLVCACGAVSQVSARFCAECGRQLAAPPGASRSPSVSALRTSSGSAPPMLTADAVVEERRRVTALFADISGFTALAAELDTEELLGVIDPILEAMALIVGRYDGWLEKFAGDALLALFGAPVAHEDDAFRAIRAAEDMHAEIASRRAQPFTRGLSLHVGITTGEVVARSIKSDGRAHYAVLGESVILAQRLESLAPPGETYLGATTARLVGDRVGLEDLGEFTVKGRTEPVEVFRLVGRTATAGRPRGRMIGRTDALATAAAAVAAAESGTGSVLRIVGPPGIGKSRLLDEVRARASREGTRCVDIAGASYTRAAYRSLAPLVEEGLAVRYPEETSVHDRLRRLESDDSAPASAVHTSLLLGELDDARSFGGRVPEGIRRDLHRAALGWLLDLAGHGPLVLLVDNLQWLERSSIELLSDLAAATSGTSPVLFCLSGRSEPVDDGPLARGTTVRLDPLTPEQVHDLTVDELGLAPDERLVDFVVDRSKGIPLAVREIGRQLRAERLLDVRDGHAHMIAGSRAQQIPSSLESLLNARVDTLSAPAVAVAVASAAIGYVVPDGLLVLVAGQDAATLRPMLEELADADILTTAEDGLAFSSPLVRDVLYARLTGRRRRILHARIANAIEDPQFASTTAPALLASLLAEHRYLAGEEGAALHWLRAAAERSRQVFAHDDAVVALTRAIEAARSADPGLVPALLCDLADVRTELGEYARAGDLYRQSSELAATARSVAGQAASLRRSESYADAERVLRAAIGTPIGGDERLVWRELSWVLSVSGDLDGSLTAAAHGLGLAADDDAVAGQLRCQMVRAETLLGRYDAAYEHLGLALKNLEAAGDLVGLCTALRLQGSLEERTGALDEAAATLVRGLELAERTGLAEEVGGCLINLGLVHGARADHEAASDCYARAAITFEQTGNRAGRAMAYGNRAYELLALGESGSARELARRGLALADEVGSHMTAADIHHTLALISEEVGDPAAALHEAGLAIAEFGLAGLPEAADESRELARRVSGTTPDR